MFNDEEIALLVVVVSGLSCLMTSADKAIQKRFNLCREDSENILSMGHAILVVQLVQINVGRLEAKTFHPTNKATLSEEIALIFSCSYFLYDTFRWRYRGRTSVVMLLHHVVSILAIVNALARKSWCTHGNFALLILEGANSLLHLRRILIGEGLNTELIFHVTEWSFFLGFLSFRFVLGFRYVMFLRHSQAPVDIVATSYVLFAISAVFLIRIVSVLKMKISGFVKTK